MIAVFKKELSVYFHSVIGFLFIGALLFLLGLYTTIYNLFSGYSSLAYPLQGVTFLLIILVSVLTMRSFSEERKNKADQLLFTSPVSVTKIVAGKFLAMGTIYTIPIALYALVPLILNKFGTMAYGEAYTVLFDFYLFGLATIAIGLLISSLTENQIVSAVLTFVILLIFYYMDSICYMISEEGNVVTKILSSINLYTPFVNMANGTFSVKTVVYYISVIVVAIILTTQLIQKRRYSISKSNLGMGSYSLITILVSIAVVVFINIAVGKLPEKYINIDVTPNKLYTLADETEEFVKGINEDIDIFVLGAEDSYDTTVASTLRNISDLNSHLSVEYVDPMVNPKFYTQYTDAQVSNYSIIVSGAKRSTVVDYSEIYESEIDYSTYQQYTTGYDGEGQIVSALAYVTSEDMPKAYMIQGHDELALGSNFTDAFAKQNIDYESINLMDVDEIGSDISFVIINSPTKDFSNDDTQKVKDYINNGGRLIITLALIDEETPNLDSILAEYNVAKQDGLIVEDSVQNYYQSPFYLLPDLASSSLTSGIMSSGGYIFAPYCQGISVIDENSEDVSFVDVLTTSEDAYAKTDYSNITSFDRSEGDQEGPFIIAKAAEKDVEGGVSKALVVGTEYLFTDDTDSMVSGNNSMLFSNCLSSIVGEQETGIYIPSKSFDSSMLSVSMGAIILLAVTMMILFPVGCIVAGIVIWLVRRKR